MINNTQLYEKSKVNKCQTLKTKTAILIEIIVKILNIIIINKIKFNRTNHKKCIEQLISEDDRITELFDNNIKFIDEKLIEKTIICCSVVCKSSISNTKEFLKQIFGYKCSTGKISNIINKYSVKARELNESIDLSNIKFGANDEIFKASKPVLVGVEPKSNYIYLMELEEKRDGTTWWFHLEQKSQLQGLRLDKSINDAGKGLIRGINDSFDNKCKIMTDLYHCKHDFLRAVTSLERKAYSNIKVEYRMYKKVSKGKCSKESYENILELTKNSIHKYDTCHELYKLFEKCTKIGGYNYTKRKDKMMYIISELEKHVETNTYINKFYNFLKNNIEGLLMFVEDFYYRMQLIVLKENISSEIFKLMWKQYSFNKYSEEYNLIEIEIINLTRNNYTKAREIFDNLIKDTIRASSIVENINSLLRPYLDLKKSPNQNFLNLLQLYFNTRKFKRSNINSKVGYSPLELYTKKAQPNFFEILGF